MLYSIFYFFMYGSSFIGMQYLTIYYKELGFESLDITKIIIISTIMSIFSSLFWGYRFDKSKHKERILYALIVGSLISFISIKFFDSLIEIMIANVVFSMFYFSLQPLFTTVTLTNVENNCQNYGTVRLFGTIGFCFFSVLIPLIKNDNTIFISMAIVSNVMLIIFTIILKKDKINTEVKKNKKYKFRELFKDRIILKFIIFVSVINITMGAYFNFFGIYFIEELGYSKTMFGVMCAISTLAEIPFLLLSNKIFNKVNIKNILMISGVATGVRWGLCAFVTTQYTLIAIQLLHGLGFIVLITTVNIYINNNCKEEYLASIQSLFFIVTLVFSKIFGSIIGGVLPKIFTQKTVFLINFGICILATLILLIGVKYDEICETCQN